METEKSYKCCNFCGEEILSTAKKCKHCGELLDAELRKQVKEEKEAEPQYKSCDFCGEEILATAKKCKHCGSIIDPMLLELQELKTNNSRATSCAPEDKPAWDTPTMIVRAILVLLIPIVGIIIGAINLKYPSRNSQSIFLIVWAILCMVFSFAAWANIDALIYM